MAPKTMPIDERYAYLAEQFDRYQRAGRSERGRLLDEMEAVTGLHRKSLIRHMTRRPARRKRVRQRGPVYDAPVQDAIHAAARSLGYPSAAQLHAVLAPTVAHLAETGRLTLTEEVRDKLARISLSTVGRILQRRKPYGRLDRED